MGARDAGIQEELLGIGMKITAALLAACKKWAGSTTGEWALPHNGTTCLCFCFQLGSWVEPLLIGLVIS